LPFDAFDALLETFFPGGAWNVETGLSGWNNTTRYVTAGGNRWVLRVYETHRDADKIRFEHAVLLELARRNPPFAVPVPLRLPSGATFVPVPDGSGRFGCLFRYIEGNRPDSSVPRVAGAVGEAVGALCRELSAVKVSVRPAYAPYYEIDATHPSCPQERIEAFCASPPPAFRGQRAELAMLAEELRQFRRYAPKLRKLPHQLIHGDVNDSNLLAAADDPERIAAVLDFEFCTWDARAMEPAVVLSGLLGTEKRSGRASAAAQSAEAREVGGDWEEAVASFVRGFGRHVRLTEAEAEAIVPLMTLRKLDVFVHFLGRLLDGVDTEDTLREQIDSAAAGLETLRRRRGKLAARCRELIGPP